MQSLDLGGYGITKILVKKRAQILETIVITVLKYGSVNVVIYNTFKTKAILFSKPYHSKLSKQL